MTACIQSTFSQCVVALGLVDEDNDEDDEVDDDVVVVVDTTPLRGTFRLLIACVASPFLVFVEFCVIYCVFFSWCVLCCVMSCCVV